MLVVPSRTPFLTFADLDFRADGVPYSRRFGDLYFSAQGGLAESSHTFLAGNGLPERWRSCNSFTIVETGFGTGLNFLATLAVWRATAPSNAQLHFLSVERFPLTKDALARCVSHWPDLATHANELIRRYPPPVAGYHRLQFDRRPVTLTLLFGDAADMLAQLDTKADAFYLDGFAPARNPEMWSAAVFREIARLAQPGATLATFTVAGDVRRGLRAAGFEVERRPGFGHKREMLAGRFAGRSVTAKSRANRDRHACIIGAGLAGTACAERLVARGWTIDLVERRSGPAQEASGVPAGVLHPALLGTSTAATLFSTAASLHAKRELEVLAAKGLQPRWAATGVFQLARDARGLARLQKLVREAALPDSVARSVSIDEASALVGAKVSGPGIWFADGCWASAPSVCEARLASAGDGVRSVFEREAVSIECSASEFRVIDRYEHVLSDAPVIILANALAAKELHRTVSLPLKRMRGQVTLIPVSAGRVLLAPICGEGYVTPALDGFHCAGASFDEDDDPAVRAADHTGNLARLDRLLPGFAPPLEAVPLQGWVGFRAMSPDRLPLVGELSGAIDGGGIYACLALGARGLTWSALAGELLASLVNGDPLPVERDIAAMLSPSRFVPHTGGTGSRRSDG